MGSITHTKVSAIADDPAAVTAGEVVPSDWNDEHTFTLTKDDVGLTNVDNTSDANKPVSTATQTALDLKVDENAAITGATKTKITYDAKGLVTAGDDATTADIADSTNRRYVTDAQQTVIGNTSGTNTGDQTSVSGSAGSVVNKVTFTNTGGAAAGTTFDGSAARTVDYSTLGAQSAALTLSGKTGAYTIVAGDLGTVINCTANSFTVSLTSAATLGAGFACWVWNTANNAAVTIDPAGAETISGLSTWVLQAKEGVQIVSDGTNWIVGDSIATRQFSARTFGNTARPSATTNGSVAIGDNAAASGAGDSLAVGVNSLSTGNSSTAIGKGSASAGNNTFATNSGTATPNYSSAIGMNSAGSGSVTATGDGSMALGGSYASGADSFAAAIANNTSSYGATGTRSVAIGYLNKASSTSAVALGNNSVASGSNSFAAGDNCEATQVNSLAMGTYAKSVIRGKAAFAAIRFATTGDAQSGKIVLSGYTVNNTPTAITTTQGAASTTNQVILPDDSTFAFTILVVARRQDGNDDSAGYKFEGVVDRNTGAATTAIVGTVAKTVLAEDSAAWDCDVTADTTNGGLAVTVTGENAKLIYWVATCWTSEVTG